MNTSIATRLSIPAAGPGTAEYEFLVPAHVDSRLSFRVYRNGAPVAWARLEKVDFSRPRPGDDRVLMLTSLRHQPTYCLRMIEVNQNYQRQGLGTALMREIFRYCEQHQIRRVVGEIKGDVPLLEHWYRSLGFRVQGALIEKIFS